MAHWRRGRLLFGDDVWATTVTFLAFVSRWPDSLIERKFGAATAQAVSHRAERIQSQVLAYPARDASLDDIRATLVQWDEELRKAGLNPGTSADLAVATAFAAKLMRA
jgi:triphosphoribosyl-dephospho-CoA synthase